MAANVGKTPRTNSTKVVVAVVVIILLLLVVAVAVFVFIYRKKLVMTNHISYYATYAVTRSVCALAAVKL